VDKKANHFMEKFSQQEDSGETQGYEKKGKDLGMTQDFLNFLG
jgi:hypothetical protein